MILCVEFTRTWQTYPWAADRTLCVEFTRTWRTYPWAADGTLCAEFMIVCAFVWYSAFTIVLRFEALGKKGRGKRGDNHKGRNYGTQDYVK